MKELLRITISVLAFLKNGVKHWCIFTKKAWYKKNIPTGLTNETDLRGSGSWTFSTCPEALEKYITVPFPNFLSPSTACLPLESEEGNAERWLYTLNFWKPLWAEGMDMGWEWGLKLLRTHSYFKLHTFPINSQKPQEVDGESEIERSKMNSLSLYEYLGRRVRIWIWYYSTLTPVFFPPHQ